MVKPKLQAKLDAIRKSWQDDDGPGHEDITLLLAIIEKQRKALEFYGDPANWGYRERINTNGVAVNAVMSQNDIQEYENGRYCCGKLARQTIAEIEEMV